MALRRILADLHVHTVLSPCAEVEMIPPLIVAQARARGLGLIAVTDHNAAANCAAVMAAAGDDLAVLPGMEVQTSEDVHVLCLFDTAEQALTWQEVVFDHLPCAENPEDVLGAQFVVDAAGGYVRTERRLLLTSADLSLEETVSRVNALGGMAIPAHVDRSSYSLLAQLGFAPPGLAVPALELFRLTDPDAARMQHPGLSGWPLIRGGDAHRLSEISPALAIEAADATVAELRMALAGQQGRAFELTKIENLGPI